MLERYVKRMLDAPVYDVARETPLSPAPALSERLGQTVHLKREDLQPIFSFKIRGAYNKIAQLSQAERAAGVVAASAGNHAQGVALSAARLGIRAQIVMGRNTPSIKVDAVRARGAEVVLHGDTFDEAAEQAQRIVDAEGAVFVHPYDDPAVIAGQGTVAMEVLRQHGQSLGAVFVPVGGGGLVAGMAAYVKYLRPATRIVGVEAEGSACLTAALAAGERAQLPYESLDPFADGVAVTRIGRHPFDIAREHVDAVVTVSTDEICAAVKDVFDDTRAVAEPAGALAVAGMKRWVERGERTPGSLVAVISGANVNFDRLRHISERAEIGERREAILAVTIPERPGSFQRFCEVMGRRSVTEFNYRYADPDRAQVFAGFSVGRGGEDRDRLIEAFESGGYAVVDMTDNDMAKVHVRHMVGGRALVDLPELLYRFEFPERPGALANFLDVLGGRWNIALFHYRNHGAAWGRVLVGFHARAEEREALAAYLELTGYRYREETDNPAYAQFLA